MITPVKKVPLPTKPDYFAVQLALSVAAYPDGMFWQQDDGQAFLTYTNGDLIVSGDGNAEELAEFIAFLQPGRVFAETQTLERLHLKVDRPFRLFCRKPQPTDTVFLSGETDSRGVYTLLQADGLELPDYETFAVDFCRKFNRGILTYFALPKKCAAVCQSVGDCAILSGIASHEKGYGTVALYGICQKVPDKTVLVCCRPDVAGFYEKNGFVPCGTAGYWENK